ncbi:hypothetical protein, partial [uncultured Intestinimonas sp.]|uniref:hypothetical protein n=1 Tax=uncultured Intestinimonas sp. TaxID=1689265 RepID=UPI002943A995
ATPLHLKLNISYQGLFFVLSAQSGAVRLFGTYFFSSEIGAAHRSGVRQAPDDVPSSGDPI